MNKFKFLINIELIFFLLIILSSCGRNNEHNKTIKQKLKQSNTKNYQNSLNSKKESVTIAKLKDSELPENIIKKIQSKLSFDGKNKVVLEFNRSNTNKWLAEKCFKLLYDQAGTLKEQHSVLLDLGVNYAHFQRFDESISTLNKVIEELLAEDELDSYNLEKAYDRLALVNMSAGNFEAQLKNAQEAYNYALKTGHTGVINGAETNFAIALANNGKFDEAMEIIKRKLKKNPNDFFLKTLHNNILQYNKTLGEKVKINIMNMRL